MRSARSSRPSGSRPGHTSTGTGPTCIRYSSPAPSAATSVRNSSQARRRVSVQVASTPAAVQSMFSLPARSTPTVHRIPDTVNGGGPAAPAAGPNHPQPAQERSIASTVANNAAAFRHAVSMVV